MTDLNKIKNIYFLGIGGIGMSALARYFRHKGMNVAGYVNAIVQYFNVATSQPYSGTCVVSLDIDGVVCYQIILLTGGTVPDNDTLTSAMDAVTAKHTPGGHIQIQCRVYDVLKEVLPYVAIAIIIQ